MNLHRYKTIKLLTLVFICLYSMTNQAEISFQSVAEKLPFQHGGLESGISDGMNSIVWFDYNNDGNIDIFIPNGVGQPNGLFENQGDGNFSDVGEATGINDVFGHTSALAIDFNNDGHQDVVLTGTGGLGSLELSYPRNESPMTLYKNNGDGTFSDVTEGSGLFSPEGSGYSMSAADVDGDKDIDLFVADLGRVNSSLTAADNSTPSLFFRNDGNFTFTEVAHDVGIITGIKNGAYGPCASLFSDVDSDGDQDLLLANCNKIEETGAVPAPLQLFENRSRRGKIKFKEATAQAGLSDILGFWMAVAPGDVDGDGDVDLFLTSVGNADIYQGTSLDISPHVLLINEGGKFIDKGAEWGVADHEFGWGAVLKDFDNDGRPDLFFAGTVLSGNPNFHYFGPTGNPGKLFRNTGNSFEDISVNTNVFLSYRLTIGIAAGDYNGDGFVDIIGATENLEIMDPNLVDGYPIFLENTTTNDNRWVAFDLEGSKSNRDAVGAKVTLYSFSLHSKIVAKVKKASKNRKKIAILKSHLKHANTNTQEVHAGDSIASMSAQRLHFGLGSNNVALVKIEWPSGQSNYSVLLESEEDFNRVITILE